MDLLEVIIMRMKIYSNLQPYPRLLLRFSKSLVWGVLLSFILSACAASRDLPAQAMEEYYRALAKKDLNSMISLACPEWEEQARNEYTSFAAVAIELQDLECKTTSKDGSKAIVNCLGKIVANYGNEILEIDLAKLAFQLIEQGGTWRFCGYP